MGEGYPLLLRMVLKVCSLDQQQHLGARQKCRMPGPTSDLLSETLVWDMAICVLTSLQGKLDGHWILRD